MYLLSRLRSCTRGPISRWLSIRCWIKPESRKALKQSDEKEGGLMVRKLLAEADARSSVEGAEDEWVWRQIFMHPFIKESVRVKFESFWANQKNEQCAECYRDAIPSGPQRSVLRWRLMTPYMQLERVLCQTAKGSINSTHVVFAGMYNDCWFRGVTTTGRVDRLITTSDG